jgi:hypothetical protein
MLISPHPTLEVGACVDGSTQIRNALFAVVDTSMTIGAVAYSAKNTPIVRLMAVFVFNLAERPEDVSIIIWRLNGFSMGLAGK